MPTILKFAFATYLVNIAAGQMLALLLALLSLPPAAFYTPWLHHDWIPLAPYPRLLAGFFISIVFWVFATFLAGFLLKPLSPFRQTRQLPVSAWIEDWLVEGGRHVFGLLIIAASVWAAPRLDTEPVAVLKVFAVLAVFTLDWALWVKDSIWRQSRTRDRRNEDRQMLHPSLRA